LFPFKCFQSSIETHGDCDLLAREFLPIVGH
jgi:hypothetical protein